MFPRMERKGHMQGEFMRQGFFLKAYGVLWRLLMPFLRRNRRLAEGWEERLVPADWLAHVPWAMRERRGCDLWGRSPPCACRAGSPARTPDET